MARKKIDALEKEKSNAPKPASAAAPSKGVAMEVQTMMDLLNYSRKQSDDKIAKLTKENERLRAECTTMASLLIYSRT